MRLRTSLLVLTASAAVSAPVRGQDVELLSRIYGTPLPAGYTSWRAANPNAFQFAHGRALRMRERMESLRQAPGLQYAPQAVFGRRETTVQGTFHLPVILGLYADSPPDPSVPIPKDRFETAFFGDGTETVTAYYKEVSGNRVTLLGDVHDWVRSDITQSVATGGVSGLGSPSKVGDFIVGLLNALPSGMDWGAYDNDGPDGVPNSGDDDGFVDALAVIQPTSGAECGGTNKENKIWSHKWSLSSATSTHSSWTTATAAANGGFIMVDDYFIQPALSCSGFDVNQIGVFTHEAGHAFGLPDLYDTRSGSTHNGDGNWDLMATGAWGCNGKSPASPCHMGAWSKSVLGWADVVTLGANTDLGTLTLNPVETGGTVYRLDAGDASGTYYLLENRQPLGFDQYLFKGGMLVWQITPSLVNSRWPSNSVNSASTLGVWLRQADGRSELETVAGGRGDAGDPFPYEDQTTANRVFHATSNPASRALVGTATGVTLLDIQRVGTDITLHASTRFTNVTVRSQGDSGTGGLFAVDGTSVPGVTHTFASAPYEVHQVEAAAGEEEGAGMRRPFTGWTDDALAQRIRNITTSLEDETFTATYGGTQVQLDVTQTGGVNGVTPATFQTDPASPDLWFPEDVTVSIQAVPRTGFGFLKWTGALEGQANPATITMDTPKTAGADFEVTYKVPSVQLDFAAAEAQDQQLTPENGTAPFYWYVEAGTFPEGMHLTPGGRLTGAALETGTFTIHVRVEDAIHLSGEGDIQLVVGEPALSAAALGSPFLLAGPTLTDTQASFLDRQGNKSGAYDLGDFRAWVLAHPNLPMSAALRALVGPTPATPRGGTEEVIR